MKRYSILTLLICLLVVNKSPAQSISESVVSPLGGIFSVDGLEYSFTLGEAVVLEFISDELSLSSGYEESSLEELVTALENNVDISYTIKIYPNPAESMIHLDFENHRATDYKVLIFNVNGEIVLEQMLDKNLSVSAIDVSWLQPGNYLLNINSIEDKTYGFVHITKL